eukprot:scaffold4285_cov109-Isochrysis_galbana.AAC.3
MCRRSCLNGIDRLRPASAWRMSYRSSHRRYGPSTQPPPSPASYAQPRGLHVRRSGCASLPSERASSAPRLPTSPLPAPDAPFSPALLQMNEVLQPLSARGATTNQTKRPRVEDASAGPRPVCPRVDTPSSSQGAGTQFVNGRQADPRFHHDVRHGNGQCRNGQLHYGGSQYADI